MKQIAQAIINVMAEIKGIEKSKTIGTGRNAYKGVADQEVKKTVGDAMQKHGLCVIPTGIKSTVQIERWQHTDQYGTKQKQQVFNEVETEYLLLHTSGESLTFVGSGHGIDSQDKAAGKATTYALKYALLYLFMIPTGAIDDADSEHSNDKDVPMIMLTDLEFETTKVAPKKSITAVLNAFDGTKGKSMTDTQREALLKLVK